MARRVLLRSAALPLALMLLMLGLGSSDAFVVQQPPPRRGSGVRPQTTTTILLRMRAGPHDQPQQQQKHQQPRPIALPTLARLQRALAPLALSLLPVLAPRPLTPPAAAAAAGGTAAATTTTQQPHAQGTLLSAPLLLVADGVDVAAIKQVADAEALAGFGKAQGEGGERLMGLVQPVLRLMPDQEGLFKVRSWGVMVVFWGLLWGARVDGPAASTQTPTPQHNPHIRHSARASPSRTTSTRRRCGCTIA